MAAQPGLAVQIVNYRTRAYLELCLASVVADLDRSGLEYEINLLDNASGESLDDLAARFPRCSASTAPGNLGFGAGHNLLSRRTEAPYLLILNPDVEFVARDTASRLLAVLRSADRAKVAGPKLIAPSGSPEQYDHGRLHGLRAQIALRGGHSYWRATGTRLEVAWVSGAASLIERDAFASVGGFDEKFFLYKEEEDLCLRLRLTGAQIIYEPSIVVRHHRSVVANRSRSLAESSSYFFAKHFPHQRTRRAYARVHQALAYVHL